jgi:acid phosphatase (class A)
MTKFMRHSLALVLFATVAVFATAEAITPSHIYLKRTPEEWERTLPSPPLVDSKTQKDDLGELLKWQNKRTDAECKRAASESHRPSQAIFFGPEFHVLTQAQLDSVTPLLDSVRSDLKYAVDELKAKFNRPRPYDTYKELHTCVDHESNLSYPSGHATTSHLIALILGQIDPKNAKKYLARADEIALDRVIGGVHYPSDIAAGKFLAEKMFADLKENTQFQNDLKKYKLK